MPRNMALQTYHEVDITHVSNIKDVMRWCETTLRGDWNVIADSGPRAARGDGSHMVTLLMTNHDDLVLFRMAWR